MSLYAYDPQYKPSLSSKLSTPTIPHHLQAPPSSLTIPHHLQAPSSRLSSYSTASSTSTASFPASLTPTAPVIAQRPTPSTLYATPTTLSSPTPATRSTLHTNLYAPLTHRVLPTRTSLQSSSARASPQHTLDKVLDKVKKTLNENAALRERAQRGYELPSDAEFNFERSPSPILPHQKSYIPSFKHNTYVEQKTPLTTAYLSSSADFTPKDRDSDPNEEIIRMLEVNRKKYQDLMQKLADADTRLMVNKERYNEVKESLAVALKNLELENSKSKEEPKQSPREPTPTTITTLDRSTSYHSRTTPPTSPHSHSTPTNSSPPPPASHHAKPSHKPTRTRSPPIPNHYKQEPPSSPTNVTPPPASYHSKPHKANRTRSPPIPPHHYSRSNTPSPNSDLLDSEEEYANQSSHRGSSLSSPTNRAHYKSNGKSSYPPSSPSSQFQDSLPRKHLQTSERLENGYKRDASIDANGHKRVDGITNGISERDYASLSDSDEGDYQHQASKAHNYQDSKNHPQATQQYRKVHNSRSPTQPASHTAHNTSIEKDERIRRLEAEMAVLRKQLELLRGGTSAETTEQTNPSNQRTRSTTEVDQQYLDERNDFQGRRKRSTTELDPPPQYWEVMQDREQESIPIRNARKELDHQYVHNKKHQQGYRKRSTTELEPPPQYFNTEPQQDYQYLNNRSNPQGYNKHNMAEREHLNNRQEPSRNMHNAPTTTALDYQYLNNRTNAQGYNKQSTEHFNRGEAQRDTSRASNHNALNPSELDYQYLNKNNLQGYINPTELDYQHLNNNRNNLQGYINNRGATHNEPAHARTTMHPARTTNDSSSYDAFTDDVSDDSDEEITFSEPPRNAKIDAAAPDYELRGDVYKYGNFAAQQFTVSAGDLETESGEEVVLSSKTLEEKIRGL